MRGVVFHEVGKEVVECRDDIEVNGRSPWERA
jgi:hypothetical protein